MQCKLRTCSHYYKHWNYDTIQKSMWVSNLNVYSVFFPRWNEFERVLSHGIPLSFILSCENRMMREMLENIELFVLDRYKWWVTRAATEIQKIKYEIQNTITDYIRMYRSVYYRRIQWILSTYNWDLLQNLDGSSFLSFCFFFYFSFLFTLLLLLFLCCFSHAGPIQIVLHIFTDG